MVEFGHEINILVTREPAGVCFYSCTCGIHFSTDVHSHILREVGSGWGGGGGEGKGGGGIL